jgi:hypothetical protein
MISINGFRLHSLTAGCKYTRTFSVDSARGLIVDHVLGECGAPASPFPDDFYDRVGHGNEGLIELTGQKKSRNLVVTRDNMGITERRDCIDGEEIDEEEIFARAKHIIPSALSFVNNPKAIFIGFAWQFSQDKIHKRGVFTHPCAELIAKKLIKLKLVDQEFPAETNVSLTFRRKIVGSLLKKGEDDYSNIILTISDTNVNALWPSDEPKKRHQTEEDQKAITITVDIQRILKPSREITSSLMQQHWQSSRKILDDRILEIVRGAELINNVAY